MREAQFSLRDMKREHKFLIGIDSDGCAFDSMEIKHKECFIPNIIKHWGLQAVSKFAREAAEFVNLYSKWRGVNRFPALTMVFDLLADWPEVTRRNVTIPEVKSLRDWIERESLLGNPALKAEVAKTNDEVLTKTLEWSLAINATVEDMVHGVPPFPHVRESLEKAGARADMLVVSATPTEALTREWEEHDIAQFVNVIAGQEQGKKAEHLEIANGGNYEPSHILMIGDAPGDMKAARANNALFYPILPGNEEKSWERFNREAADKFFDGSYAGDYEATLIEEFNAVLPEVPAWHEGI